MILFIGPCENIKNKEKTGGIIVLFEDLLDWSDNNNISYELIDTNKSNYKNKIVAILNIFCLIFKNTGKVFHVSLHGTAKDYLYIAPFVVLMAKIYNKKVHLRKFAGNFDSIYNESNFLIKRVYEYVLKSADMLFFETKKLVLFGKNFNERTFWLPNTREKPMDKHVDRIFSKKFVFISQVKNTKGVIEILKAKKSLSSNYIIDIFGPIQEGEFELHGMGKPFENAYKGILNKDNVQVKLREYDVVLLPTYHEGEGYPGIILESFSLGKPVISTLWNSIEELVVHDYNGFLVPIKDYKALMNSILKFNKSNHKKMASNALKSFEQFDRNTNYKKYIDLICSI